MDDTLLADSQGERVLLAYVALKDSLHIYDFQVAPEKVQQKEPYWYLCFQLFPKMIKAQKISIRKDFFNTLNDFQKLLGDIVCDPIWDYLQEN